MGDGDFRSTETSVTVAERDARCASSTSPPTAPSPCSSDGAAGAGRRDRRRRGDAQGARWTRSSPSRSPTPRTQGVLFSVHLKATMMKVSRPDHLRPRGAGLLRRRVRPVRRRPRLASAPTRTTGWPASSTALEKLPDDKREAIEKAITAAYETGPALAMVDSDRGHHQPARAERRDHRRVDAGRDPHVRADVERRRRAAGHQVRHPGLVLRARSTPRPSTSAASTARSTRRRWAPRPTSG